MNNQIVYQLYYMFAQRGFTVQRFNFRGVGRSQGAFDHGKTDKVLPQMDVQTLVDKLKTQKGIVIDHQEIPGANHFFESHMDDLMERCGNYLDSRLGPTPDDYVEID